MLAAAPFAHLAPVTVLLADGHAEARARLHGWLAAYLPQASVLTAGDGDEAVVMALANPLDLILLDCSLPRLNGLEAARQIRAGAPRARVVLLTQRGSAQEQSAAWLAGASAYVEKGRLPAELPRLLEQFFSPEQVR